MLWFRPQKSVFRRWARQVLALGLVGRITSYAVQLSIGPVGLTRSADSPTSLRWQQLFTTAVVAAKAKVLWTGATSTRASDSDGAVRARGQGGAVFGRQSCARRPEQTRAAQTAEYKETGLTTIETNRREAFSGCGVHLWACARVSRRQLGKLETGRADDGSARRRSTDIRAADTWDARGRGRGPDTGATAEYNLVRTEWEARQGEATASVLRSVLEEELPRVCGSRILRRTRATRPGRRPTPGCQLPGKRSVEADDWQCAAPKMKMFRRPARPQAAYSRPCLYLHSAPPFLCPCEVHVLVPTPTNPIPRGGGAPSRDRTLKDAVVSDGVCLGASPHQFSVPHLPRHRASYHGNLERGKNEEAAAANSFRFGGRRRRPKTAKLPGGDQFGKFLSAPIFFFLDMG